MPIITKCGQVTADSQCQAHAFGPARRSAPSRRPRRSRLAVERRVGKALAGDVRCKGTKYRFGCRRASTVPESSRKMCKPFLLVAMLSVLLASCSQQDKNEAKRKIENAKQELRRDLHKAGQEIKKDSHDAAVELRNDAHDAKKKMHKESDDPSRKANKQ